MAVAVLKIVHNRHLATGRTISLHATGHLPDFVYFENYNVRAMLVLLLHRSSDTGLR